MWLLGDKAFQKAVVSDVDFENILVQMMDRLRSQDLVLFVVLVRSIWLRRNKLIFDGSFQDSVVLYTNVVTEVATHRAAMETTTTQLGKLQSQPPQWEAPPPNWVKANWDIAINSSNQHVGIGVVIRDDKGYVLLSMMKPLSYCVEPSIAKSRGLLEAITIRKDFNLQDVILEGDSLKVVDAMLH